MYIVHSAALSGVHRPIIGSEKDVAKFDLSQAQAYFFASIGIDLAGILGERMARAEAASAPPAGGQKTDFGVF